MEPNLVLALLGQSTPWIVGLFLLLVIDTENKKRGNNHMGLELDTNNGKLLMFVFLAGLVGGGGGGYMNSKIHDPRPDPFTGTQAELMKQELLLHINRTEDGIRKDMPPPSTKARIRSMEQYLERIGRDNGNTFEPPTYKWY